MNDGIYQIEGPWQGKLAIITRPRGNEWLQDEMARLKKNGFDTILSLLEQNESSELGLVQEKAIVEANGMQWLSFPIPDRGVSTSLWRAVELLQRLDQSLSNGTNVAIHCRQGVGRSAMIAAALLVLQSASVQKISAANAFERIQRVRGTSVPDTVEQRSWVEALIKLEKVPIL